MATILEPVGSREVVRCDRCHLVQFQTQNQLCKRCHASLDPEEPVLIEVAAPTHAHPHLQIAAATRTLRQRSGLSQRQLALRMQVPRTYVGKIENEKAMPTLSSLERLAHALQVSVPDLLSGGIRSQHDEIRELMADPFIAELVPYVSKLSAMQRSDILSLVRDMTTRARKSS